MLTLIMTFAHVVAPKKAILSDLKSSKATKARRGEATGPLRLEHAFSSFFLHCGHQSWTHSRGWRSWFEGLRNFVFGCAVTSWTQGWSEEMSDGPRDEEDGSGGTKEAGTFQTHGDSAQDASPLCRCWFSLIDLLTVPVCFIHWYQFKAFGLIYLLSLG